MEKYNPQKVEKEVLKFWERAKIYEKQKRMAKRGAPKFYFLQGPPYTSGSFHIAHAWNNALKDMVLRYKRMCGFEVWDRAGWDMHGLPTENGTAKKLGLKTKEDIEKFGVEKFVKECEKFALYNMHLMERDMVNTGVWMDLKNAYMPIKTEFMESVWWIIKRAYENKRIYEGLKVMTWCANCATALAKHELEYETDEEESIFLKFPIAGRKNEFLVIWTTTPWTIPFNLGIMVNPEEEYAYVRVGGETWIVAKALANVLMGMLGKKYKILRSVKGEKLEGLEYVPPFWDELEVLKEIKKRHKWAFRVLLSSEYVDTSAGSGLVHCAPGSGPEDQEVGRRYKLPEFNELDEMGFFSSKMGKFAGWKAKRDDLRFVRELENKGLLVATTKISHEYPHCWRCHEPVIFRATRQWFMKVEDLKERMRKLNKKVFWVPKWAGERAFDSWLQNLRDNSISRQRYWGTPLPIWKCGSCKKRIVVESVSELRKLAKKVPKNIHKPWIDEVEIKCDCGGVMRRVPDVIDVWIDSGATSFASLDYPKRKDLFKKWWPADFILEATEQVRLWFNTLLIASMVATGKHPYKAVYVHGMINDAQGRKMSKSLGNYISPYEVIDKWGADTLRYYMIGASEPGQEIRYNFDDMKVRYRSLEVLWNTANYLIENARLAKVNPVKVKPELGLEEKYMLSRLNSATKQATKYFEKYLLNEVPWVVEELFLELSRWYIKATRERADGPAVLYTIFYVLLGCLKLLAPVAPFITEAIYQELRKKFGLKVESIHLYRWPVADEKRIDKKLEQEMAVVKKVVSLILAGREKMQRGIRWPIKEVVVVAPEDACEIVVKHSELIKKMTNCWKINSAKRMEGVDYDIKADYSKIAPKFGAFVAPIVRKITEMSPESILRKLGSGKLEISVNGKKVKLLEEDLIIEEILPKHLVGVKEGKLKVYLNKEETKDMLSVGFAREITRKVQSLRKRAGLVKKDRIVLEIVAPLDLAQELGELVDEIRERVGADSLSFVAHTKRKYREKFIVRGKALEIGFDVLDKPKK